MGFWELLGSRQHFLMETLKAERGFRFNLSRNRKKDGISSGLYVSLHVSVKLHLRTLCKFLAQHLLIL